MPISAGVPAPDFKLMDDEGFERQLSDYKGRIVVLYFYPKDDTPGCTTEACNFRDDYHGYTAAGVVILGISPDNIKSHKKFKDKYSLPFPLLADPGHKIAELYGVWGRKKMMGNEYDGIFRTTFLIGPDGKITRVFEGVKPAEHSAEVLGAIHAK